MLTIEVLRLFWYNGNVSFKVFRNAILTAGIAENLFGSWGSALDPAGAAYNAPQILAGGEGLIASPQNPSAFWSLGPQFSAIWASLAPLSKISRSATCAEAAVMCANCPDCYCFHGLLGCDPQQCSSK